jgi:hypothetical protein
MIKEGIGQSGGIVESIDIGCTCLFCEILRPLHSFRMTKEEISNQESANQAGLGKA